jgi:transcriptional regulator with XRE-family HTH domain
VKTKALQENLRRILWSRIDAGQLTGLKLARQAGFQQAHVSNFLNRKRNLSLESMDRILAVQHLSVLDLLDPDEVSKRATILPPSDDQFDNVLLVDAHVAARDPLISSEDVKDILKFKKPFLKRLRADLHGPRSGWRRFVILKADAREGMSMYPRLMPGATLLIDRHYNSLQPYRRGESNMYAVAVEDGCVVRYVELAGKNLVLRPHNQAYAVDVLPVDGARDAADRIIGRVCHIGIET